MRSQPKVRLPKNWRVGLPQTAIDQVLMVERYSRDGLFITRIDGEGYAWVRLCTGHPYAGNKRGWQRLHRYLMMRKLGRRLYTSEHVHHEPGAAKTTTNLRELSLIEDATHNMFHYSHRRGVHCGCTNGHGDVVWKPRDKQGRFTKMPSSDLGSDAVPF